MPDSRQTLPDDLTESIIRRCIALGFAAAGVSPVVVSQWSEALKQWIAEGKHGEMQYLADRVEQMLDPRKMVPGAQSIICVADRYHDGEGDSPLPVGQGRIARYARGEDYHRVMKKRLHLLCDELRREFPEEEFRPCVDTAPVLEREHAQRAGLGAVGKHTLLIERGVGSCLLLGEIITTLAHTPTTPADDDPCGTCTRCLDACPTDAITEFSVDATRCISYLTIEHRGQIDERFHKAMGAWIFGCDICQEVCPHNQSTSGNAEAEVHAAYAPRRSGFDLLTVLGWTEEDRREAFRSSALKRAKLDMMKRNAIIAAGNAITNAPRVTEDIRALRTRVLAISGDDGESELVRRTARGVISRLAEK